MSWADHLATFVGNPIVMTLLITIGLIGIAIELIHPGFGAPGIIGITAFTLYFLGQYISGLANWGSPILFVLGIILLLIEIFVSSFGALGIIGFLMLIAGIVTAAPSLEVGLTAVLIGLVITAVIIWALIKYFGLKTSWNKLILQSSQKNDQGYISSEDRHDLLGQIGKTITPLRPSGYAQFDERREDVVSEGGRIPANVLVKVIQVEGTRVVVRQVEENDKNDVE
jgi:membrane-bound serine protease (ClpP class)